MIKIEHHPYRKPLPVRNKYNFADMNVGDRLTVPVPRNERPAVMRSRVDTAVRMWRQRNNMGWWRFVIEYDDENVYVYRMEDTMTGGTQ